MAGLGGSPLAGMSYSAAKAAVVEYTRCLAEQLRPANVTVNSIAPGDTRTARYLGTREVPEDRLVSEGTLERVALIDEVARVVELFAGPMGDFITGQVLRVDGGSVRARLWKLQQRTHDRHGLLGPRHAWNTAASVTLASGKSNNRYNTSLLHVQYCLCNYGIANTSILLLTAS